MRAIEYGLLVVLVGIAVVYGANRISDAIAGSMNNSAILIANAGAGH